MQCLEPLLLPTKRRTKQSFHCEEVEEPMDVDMTEEEVDEKEERIAQLEELCKKLQEKVLQDGNPNPETLPTKELTSEKSVLVIHMLM